jgi:hypothetical protein
VNTTVTAMRKKEDIQTSMIAMDAIRRRLT